MTELWPTANWQQDELMDKAKSFDISKRDVQIELGKQADGHEEPYDGRLSRTVLWGTGGAIPPVYSTQADSAIVTVCAARSARLDAQTAPMYALPLKHMLQRPTANV